jgi:predicted dehydrogenase
LYAVGSRSSQKAEMFAKKYGAEHWYDRYDRLISDKNVEIIYIATPHNLHYELTKQCLSANKHVLCEKPVTMNQLQFEELRDLAVRKNLFYMDALWTRFLPHIEKLLEYTRNNKAGSIKYLSADFGIKPPHDPAGRLFNPVLGGGSLLDIGIYPVFLSLLILGYPEEIKVTAFKGETGVDESCSMIFKYQSGVFANLFCTFLVNTATIAKISGTKGSITTGSKFFTNTSLEFCPEVGDSINHEFTLKHNGYEYEAEEVMKCIDQGLIESPRLPLDFTSLLMKLLDEIRKNAGISYSSDR